MTFFDVELIITDGEGGSSVRHNDDRLVPHLPDVFKHLGFGLFIQGACRLVQEKDRGIGKQGPRDRHTLGLALGEADAASFWVMRPERLLTARESRALPAIMSAASQSWSTFRPMTTSTRNFPAMADTRPRVLLNNPKAVYSAMEPLKRFE